MKKYGARELIIQTAIKLVDINGYANTNIIEIAKKADISVGTLYYHFPRGKIDILLALIREISQDFKEEARVLGFRAGLDFSTINEALVFYLSLIIKLHKIQNCSVDIICDIFSYSCPNHVSDHVR